MCQHLAAHRILVCAMGPVDRRWVDRFWQRELTVNMREQAGTKIRLRKSCTLLMNKICNCCKAYPLISALKVPSLWSVDSRNFFFVGKLLHAPKQYIKSKYPKEREVNSSCSWPDPIYFMFYGFFIWKYNVLEIGSKRLCLLPLSLACIHVVGLEAVIPQDGYQLHVHPTLSHPLSITTPRSSTAAPVFGAQHFEYYILGQRTSAGPIQPQAIDDTLQQADTLQPK